MKKLRPYQESAIKSMALSIKKGNRPVGVIFCGGGKSLIISEIIRRILKKNSQARVLVLVDTKELVSQNYIEFCELAGFGLVSLSGVYSSGLKKKDKGKQILFGGIQSYVKHAPDSGAFDFIIIDECHLVPTNNKSQYRRVLSIEQEKNPHVKCMGFTGTPWRLDIGPITGGGVFNDVACNISCTQLINEGYLVPPVTYSLDSQANLTDVEIKNGEFVEAQASKAFMAVLPAQVKEILVRGANRKKWLIFCQSKEHATAMFNALNPYVEGGVGLVFGDSKDRDQTINAFKLCELRVLVNVQVLKKGFNCPDIDLVCMCFATQSVSNYVQVPPRGMRISPGKRDCLILDFGGNIERHGPIDNINVKEKKEKKEKQGAPMKQCPECGDLVPLNSLKCLVCGHVFKKNEGKNLTKTPKEGGILSSELEVLEVEWMIANTWVTKSGIHCVIIDFYRSKSHLFSSVHKEFLNFWNPNIYVVKKAWNVISMFIPTSKRENVTLLLKKVNNAPQMTETINTLIEDGIIKVPKRIFLGQKGDKIYKKLVMAEQ